VRRVTYHLHVPVVLKFESLNLLEPYGPVQGCNGIALHLPLPFRALACLNRQHNVKRRGMIAQTVDCGVSTAEVSTQR
jgi:hypothetical protein